MQIRVWFSSRCTCTTGSGHIHQQTTVHLKKEKNFRNFLQKKVIFTNKNLKLTPTNPLAQILYRSKFCSKTEMQNGDAKFTPTNPLAQISYRNIISHCHREKLNLGRSWQPSRSLSTDWLNYWGAKYRLPTRSTPTNPLAQISHRVFWCKTYKLTSPGKSASADLTGV